MCLLRRTRPLPIPLRLPCVDQLRGRWLIIATVAALIAFAGSAGAMGELVGATAAVLVLANTLPLLMIGRNPLVVVLGFAVLYPVWLEAPGEAVSREGHF